MTFGPSPYASNNDRGRAAWPGPGDNGKWRCRRASESVGFPCRRTPMLELLLEFAVALIASAQRLGAILKILNGSHERIVPASWPSF